MNRRRAADWEPLAALWLAWPHNPNTWPGEASDGTRRIVEVEQTYRRIVEAAVESHPVRVLAAGDAAARAEDRLRGFVDVEIVDIPTDDAWVRDYGPQFVFDQHGDLTCVAFRYNAWGGKYPPWESDDAAAEKIARWLDLPVSVSGLTIEGGAMEFDGTGRMLTTPACVLDPNRNDASWTLQAVESELRRTLGVEHIAWFDGGGIDGDDTDGHVDQLIRFIDPENVVVAVTGDEDASDADALRKNLSQVDWWSNRTEPPVRVHPIRTPPPRTVDDQPVPQSYCNFVRLGPERILMPTFGCDATDDAAEGLLRELSGAEVTPIDCRNLAWGLGALHCATLEQPATSG